MSTLGLRTTGWIAPLTWRPLVFVVLVSLVLASQIFFQAGILEYEIEQTLLAYVEYIGEIAAIGFAVLIAVTFAGRAFPFEGWKRTAALAAAIVVGVALGVTLGVVVRYGDAHYPPFLFTLGEAIRWVGVAGVLTFVHEAQSHERRAAGTLHDIQLNRMALERRKAEARLQMMKAQIEPHFLFNTLATVKRLYRTSPDDGDAMLDRLMHYLLAALPRLRDDESTLGDELDLIGAYLEILRMRMGTRLSFSIEAPAELRSRSFPSMMLITLVENAIKHGIGGKPEGGRIDVKARAVPGRMRIDVADTGAGFSASSGSGIGLANVRARLAAIAAGRASLTLAANDPSGVVATIELPLARETA
jgi:hypothetical protein